MNNPLVSIIIPVYNGSNFLKEAIDSALSQTYKNIEILVVNDGSDDAGETEKIALDYKNKIKYFYKENGGVSSALNLGIEKMEGSWFSWLSHDDLYTDDKIEIAIKTINTYNDLEPKLVVQCQCEFINEKGNTLFRPVKSNIGILTGAEKLMKTFENYNINGCSLIIPKTAFIEIGTFNENYKYIQDIDCWTRLMLKSYTFVSIKDTCIKSRIHSQQGTATMPYRYYEEEKKRGIVLVEKLFENYGNRGISFVESYLYDCIKKNHYSVSNYIIKILIEKKLFSLKIKIKIILYKLLSKNRYIFKKIYYSIFTPNAR